MAGLNVECILTNNVSGERMGRTGVNCGNRAKCSCDVARETWLPSADHGRLSGLTL